MTPRDTYLRAVRVPWEELETVYTEVVATGSQRAVALARGWNQAKVKHRVESYMRHAGIEGPPPGIVSKAHSQRASLSHSGQGHRTEFRRMSATIADLEERLATALAERDAARATIADLAAEAARWAEVNRKLDTLLTRPTATVTHRRQADGGVGGRRELRAIRPAA